MSAFITGFSIGLSLILAIGAQNVFVLRQGLKRQHVSAVVLFCATSDALLIAAGVGGLGLLLAPLMAALSDWLFAGAALAPRRPRWRARRLQSGCEMPAWSEGVALACSGPAAPPSTQGNAK